MPVDQVYLTGAVSQFPSRMQPRSLGGSFWGITTYFNPAGYSNKIVHLRSFAAKVRKQGLQLLIVEAAFGDQEFILEEELADRILRIRAPDILWLKERLINLGVQSLPPDCDRVAWIDGDIFFGNSDWVSATAEKLQRYAVVQPYSSAYWLNRSVAPDDELLTPENSYLTRQGTAFSERWNEGREAIGGHMGFAWAARRDVFNQCGLYDYCIVGGGDYVAASAMYGLSAFGYLKLVCTPLQRLHVTGWMQRFHAIVRGSVSHVDGSIFHLWHGDRDNRQYVARFKPLIDSEFDPEVDIAPSASGCWQWASNKTSLHEEVYKYFLSRQEEQ
jgi:hypothetical protein